MGSLLSNQKEYEHCFVNLLYDTHFRNLFDCLKRECLKQVFQPARAFSLISLKSGFLFLTLLAHKSYDLLFENFLNSLKELSWLLNFRLLSQVEKVPHESKFSPKY